MSVIRTVAVLMGGPSDEREVSLASGRAVAEGLRESGFDVLEIDINGRILVLPDGIDAVFIALHGAFGEDGGIQAELSKRGIPYTGSNAEASRKAFDKITCKQIMAANDIPTPAYEVLKIGKTCSMGLPVVIKPARQGSSIGIHLVSEDSGMEAALADAFLYDEQVIAEKYIEGRELTVGIVADEILPIVEIDAPDTWYDYGAKYSDGTSQYFVPAPLDETCRRTCEGYARSLYRAVGCRGLARVDMRYSSDGSVYVLELNSIPGFTETSLLPKAAVHAGMSFNQLCDRVLRTAAC
jgi:D-alanine-D-alanine ligase